jgi:hypothetical protein
MEWEDVASPTPLLMSSCCFSIPPIFVLSDHAESKGIHLNFHPVHMVSHSPPL